MPTIISGGIGTAGSLGVLSNQRVIDMKDKIFLLEPSATPLVLLTSKLRKQVADNPQFEWLETEATPISDRINGGNLLAGSTSLTVDNGAYFKVNGPVAVQRTGEVMLVTAISSNTITVQRSWGGTAAAALLDNDSLSILGTSAAENETSEASHAVQKTRAFNYTEIQRDPFGVSRTLMKSRLYGGSELANLHKERGIEHGKYIELKFFFGERNEDTSGNFPRRSTGGLDEFITTNVRDFGGILGSLEEVFAAAQNDFRYGSESKLLFAGRSVVSNISLLAAGSLRNVVSESTFGLDISVLKTPFGRYNVVTHDLFEGDSYQNEAFVVELGNVGYRYIADSRTVLRTNIQAPDADGRKDEYLTEAGLERIQERTHGKWNNVAS